MKSFGLKVSKLKRAKNGFKNENPRKIKFDKGFLDKVFTCGRDGLNKQESAKRLGLSYTQFNNWYKRHDVFKTEYEKGMEINLDTVENACYKSATGFFVEEEVKEVTKIGENIERTHIRKYKKFIPPNVLAQIFILKNKRGDVWRERQEITSQQSSIIIEIPPRPEPIRIDHKTNISIPETIDVETNNVESAKENKDCD